MFALDQHLNHKLFRPPLPLLHARERLLGPFLRLSKSSMWMKKMMHHPMKKTTTHTAIVSNHHTVKWLLVMAPIARTNGFTLHAWASSMLRRTPSGIAPIAPLQIELRPTRNPPRKVGNEDSSIIQLCLCCTYVKLLMHTHDTSSTMPISTRENTRGKYTVDRLAISTMRTRIFTHMESKSSQFFNVLRSVRAWAVLELNFLHKCSDVCQGSGESLCQDIESSPGR